MITFLHLGPRVTWTASAIKSTPRNIAARPSTPKRISFPDAIDRVVVLPLDDRSLDVASLVVLRRRALLRVVLMVFAFWLSA